MAARYYKRGPLKGHWIAPNRRQRVRLYFDYLFNRYEEWIPENWPEWTYVPQLGVLDKMFGLTCKVAGHRVVNDHCGMAAHRYCEICMTRQPGAEVTK